MANNNPNGIDANAARTLISNYTENHLNAINCDPILASLRLQGAESDSRSVWFSLNTLTTFLNNLQSSAASNCNQNGNLGVRIYFGEYPEADSELWGTTSFPQSLAQYAGLHTVVMIPTYFNGMVNMDFDPAFSTAQGPMPIAQVCNMVTSNNLTQATASGTNSSPLSDLDHGSLSPPPFGLTGQFATTSGAAFLDLV